MTELSDYPPGVQCLLKDAAWHVEELYKLKLEFEAWQAAQAEANPAPCAEAILLLGTPSKAQCARIRWERLDRKETNCDRQTLPR